MNEDFNASSTIFSPSTIKSPDWSRDFLFDKDFMNFI